LQHGAAKIRSAFGTNEAGVQHAHARAIGRLELIALEPLVLPDRLQQFFRRGGAAIAQQIHRAALFPPHSVKILRADVLAAVFHAGVFARLSGKVKPAVPAGPVSGVRQNSSIGGFCLFFRELVSRRRGALVA
jgi:hypothetical protein